MKNKSLVNERLVIETLFDKKSDYNNPEQAIDQANSCDSLSTDIYTDNKRFIYELLQNADDASCKSGKLDFQIDFVGDYIVVSHKGDPFSEVDVKSICSVGDGNKSGDENKTGFKGIGFKSVFGHSELVFVKSGEYCFKFDKQESNKWNSSWGDELEWKATRRAENKDDQVRLPWQIIPIWTEIPEGLNHLDVFRNEGFNVSTIIKHDKIEELKGSLVELFSKSQILLFLRSKEVRITINTVKNLLLEKLIREDNITIIRQGGDIISEWLIYNMQFDVTEEIQSRIVKDIRFPSKLKGAKRTEISFAVLLKEGLLKPIDNRERLLFTYLPTSINYDFPFLVNANFLTDAGRESIHKDLEWNQWLFYQIPILLFSWVSQLAKERSDFYEPIISILPNKKLNEDSKLEIEFNKGYKKAIDSIPFIRNFQGDLLKVQEALFDETRISDFIGEQTLLNYINKSNNKNYSVSSFIPNMKAISVLKRIGIHIFGIENLEGFITSDFFLTEHKVEENFKLIQFLYEQANIKNSNLNAFNDSISRISFIFDENEQLQKPELIYFPSINYSNEYVTNMHFINEKVLEQVENKSEIKEWLIKLGVIEPSDLSFFEKTILNDESFINIENALEIGKCIFKLFKKGMLDQIPESKLNKIKLLSQNNSLLMANQLFLSGCYFPKINLEKVCADDFFVSNEYYNTIQDAHAWHSVFKRLGVNDTISFKLNSYKYVPLNRLDTVFLSSLVEKAEKEYWGSENNKHFFHLIDIELYHYSFFEKTFNNYEFSKLFWKFVLNEKRPKDIGKDKDCLFGQSTFINRTLYVRHLSDFGSSYFIWSLENLPVFPTKYHNCMKSSEIFLNSISQINELAGKYIPILDFDGIVSQEWQEILKFKEKLMLYDYLTILTQIWQDNELSENEQRETKNRVSLIYQKLSELYDDFYYEDKIKLKEWSFSNKLLAKDGSFCNPTELTFVTVNGFTNTSEHLKTLFIPDNCEFNTKNFEELLRLLGVQIIDSFLPDIKNKVPNTSLKNHLQFILPFFTAILERKYFLDYSAEFKRLSKIVDDTRFYNASEIILSFKNQNEIILGPSLLAYSDDSELTFKGEWKHPITLYALVPELLKLFKLSGLSSELMLLLQLSKNDIEQWIIDQGYDFISIQNKPEYIASIEKVKSYTSEEEIEQSYGLSDNSDEKSRISISQEAKENIFSVLKSNGFKVPDDIDVNHTIVSGIINPSGLPIKIVVKSGKGGKLYFNPYEWLALTEDDTQLFVVTQGNIVRNITLNDLSAVNDTFHMRFNTEAFAVKTNLKVFANFFRDLPYTHFIFETPESTSDYFQQFGLSERNPSSKELSPDDKNLLH